MTFRSEAAAPSFRIDPLVDRQVSIVNVVSTYGCNVNGVLYDACGQLSFDIFNYVLTRGRLELPLLQSILGNVIAQENGIEMLRLALDDQRQKSTALSEMLEGISTKIDDLKTQMISEFADLKTMLTHTDVTIRRDSPHQLMIESGYDGDGTSSESEPGGTPRRTKKSRVTLLTNSVDEGVAGGDEFPPVLSEGPILQSEILKFSEQFGMAPTEVRRRLSWLGPLEKEHTIHFRKMLEDVRPIDASVQDAFTLQYGTLDQGILTIPSSPGLIPRDLKKLVFNPGQDNECPLFVREVITDKWRLWTPCFGGAPGWTFDSRLGKYFLGMATFDGPDRTYAIELSLALLHRRGYGTGWTQEFVVFGRSGAHVLRRFLNQNDAGGEAEHEIAYAPILATQGWRDAQHEFVTGMSEERLPLEPKITKGGRNLKAVVVTGLTAAFIEAGDIECDGCQARLPPLAAEGPLSPLGIMGRKAGSNFVRLNSCVQPSGSTHDMTLALWAEGSGALTTYYELGRVCATSLSALTVHAGKGALVDRLRKAGMAGHLAKWAGDVKKAYAAVPTYILRSVVQARMNGKHSFNGRANLLQCDDGIRTICIHCGAVRSSIGDRQECEAFDIQMTGLGVLRCSGNDNVRYVRVGVGMTSEERTSLGSVDRLEWMGDGPKHGVMLSGKTDGLFFPGKILNRAVIREARYLNHFKVFPRVT